MKPIMQKLGVTVAMLSIFLSASAYDFEVGGIYYDITDPAAKEVEVTSKSSDSYSGDIVVPSSVTYEGSDYKVTAIGYGTFYESEGLTSITLPNTVRTIGDYTFVGCSSLTSIDIPNGVTTIGKEAFSWCSKLTTITLPNTVRTIGKDTFSSCYCLRSITSLAVTPPECGDYVFGKVDIQECTLYVPAGSLETYKQAPGWKDFNLVAEVETGIDSIEAGSAVGTTEVFNLAGEKVADTPESLPAGIYIVREGLTARKIVVR